MEHGREGSPTVEGMSFVCWQIHGYGKNKHVLAGFLSLPEGQTYGVIGKSVLLTMAVSPKKHLTFKFYKDLTCDERKFKKCPFWRFQPWNLEGPITNRQSPSSMSFSRASCAFNRSCVWFQRWNSYMSINLQFPEVSGYFLGNFPYTEIAGNQRESSNQ